MRILIVNETYNLHGAQTQEKCYLQRCINRKERKKGSEEGRKEGRKEEARIIERDLGGKRKQNSSRRRGGSHSLAPGVMLEVICLPSTFRLVPDAAPPPAPMHYARPCISKKRKERRSCIRRLPLPFSIPLTFPFPLPLPSPNLVIATPDLISLPARNADTCGRASG